ncbi:MAG: FIST C-terminal domain-containing protein [Synergistaceae bacterium]|jgi:hypothetical protein|nr:FIST C-terminal domain-containing protein [Synergistaceae bacterium]
MIRMLTAFTEEIDDLEVSVADILDQIEPDKNLLANSVGIVHCRHDFLESGAVNAIKESLPFDLVGVSTINTGAPGVMGEFVLTLTVLTSDDVQFVAGVSSQIADDMEGPVQELCERLISGPGIKPGMLMPFVPFMLNFGGDEFVAKLDSLSGGLPAFGSLAISNEPDYSGAYTIYNDGYWSDAMVLLALVGNVKPEFLSVSTLDANVLKQKAIITAAAKNVLQEINNIPAVKYLESLGLAHDGNIAGIESMPFVIDNEDGSRLIRSCIEATEEGYVICAGAIPINSVFGVATMGIDDVVASTEALVCEAVERAGGRGILMYSCVARNWTLGTKIMAEQEKVAECVGESSPYHFTYSGGEIFPVTMKDGSHANLLQNDSLIICIL